MTNSQNIIFAQEEPFSRVILRVVHIKAFVHQCVPASVATNKSKIRSFSALSSVVIPSIAKAIGQI